MKKDCFFISTMIPGDVIQLPAGTHLFTDDEAAKVEEYVNTLFHKLDDPHVLAVELTSGQP
jgi:hypothetical protein